MAKDAKRNAIGQDKGEVAYIGMDSSGQLILCTQAGAGIEYYEIGRHSLYSGRPLIEKVLTDEFEIR